MLFGLFGRDNKQIIRNFDLVGAQVFLKDKGGVISTTRFADVSQQAIADPAGNRLFDRIRPKEPGKLGRGEKSIPDRPDPPEYPGAGKSLPRNG